MRAQLGDGLLVVVDAEVDERVGEARVAAVLLHDEQRRRLLAAPVAAGRLRGGEALEQPLGERLPVVAVERRRRARRPSRRRRGCSPARRSPAPARPPAQSRHPVAGVGRRRALRVDDAELAVGAAVVRVRQARDDLRGGEPLAQAARGRRGRSAGWRSACVAIAPTPGSAHGTTEPTARNFDCVATPHCPASRSHAAIEYVATIGSAIRELRQVEVEQRAVGDERAATSGRASAAFTSSALAARTTTGWPASCARAQRLVVDGVEHERTRDVDLALERDLRDPAARRSEPRASLTARPSLPARFSRPARSSAPPAHPASRSRGRTCPSGTGRSAGCRAARARARPRSGPIVK